MARNGWDFLKTLQQPSGQWACLYDGPMFLTPGLVIAMYVTQTPIPEAWRLEIIKYLVNTANKEDGGWGLHVEQYSTVFGTAMNYVVLRLLGMEPDHTVMVKARKTLHKLGGAIGVPLWGKVWLAVLGVYDYDGINPVPPDAWLLPEWLPLHPSKWWCHTRAVYIPMSYLYSEKCVNPNITPLILALRGELYTERYENIDFSKNRNNVAKIDLFKPHSMLLKVTNHAFSVYNNFFRTNRIRQLAKARVLDLMDKEDNNTEFLDIGPVNQVLHLVVFYFEGGPKDPRVLKHIDRLEDFMWVSSKGMTMNGTNGVQVGDTAFAMQAAIEANLIITDSDREALSRALSFLDDMQIREETIPGSYRHPRLGAWPFSTKEQGYTVSDCTAEALKSVLLVQNLGGFNQVISTERLFQAVDILLSMKNSNGGIASYELVRGYSALLEQFNSAEVFEDIMSEYCYPECTTAVILGLTTFRKHYSWYKRQEIDSLINNAIKYIRNVQRDDGSWYGRWGVCFTYATMFAVDSLCSVGGSYASDKDVRRACDFLITKQLDDGGWGETFESCELGVYTQAPCGQVVQTSWALITLLRARFPDPKPLHRAMVLIMERQQPNGSWKQELVEGVFNGNCTIYYPNYKLYFPLKAAGLFMQAYGDRAVR